MSSGTTMKLHSIVALLCFCASTLHSANALERLEAGGNVSAITTDALAKCLSTVNERNNQLAARAMQHWPRNQTKQPDKQLMFAVLFTDNDEDQLCSKPAILSAFDIAVERVMSKGDLLEGFNITVEYRNTRSSSKWGPIEAFDLYVKRKPGSSHKCNAFPISPSSHI